MNKLIDPFQRRMRKVRVSLLDACNFRCLYCMPAKPKFQSSRHWISPQEIENICYEFYNHGIEEIRLTGGEPTLRKDFKEIVTRLSEIPFRKLSLTTNGYFLEPLLPFLKNTRCQHINMSIDSLQQDKFDKMSRTKGFAKTFSAFEKAVAMGFKIKINIVLMRGFNDDEIFDFIELSEKSKVTVRFLEVMKIGQAAKMGKNIFMSAKEALAIIREKIGLSSEITEIDSTSFEFKTNVGAKVGFIAPVTQSFCSSCSRWRLSADGFLRACLMSNKGLSLKGKTKQEIAGIFHEVLLMKPSRGTDLVLQNMNTIGG